MSDGGSPGPLALSTMYFQRWLDQRDLGPFFALGRELGFGAFELSHILAPTTVAAIEPGTARITAVHHPCPRPPDLEPGDDLCAAAPEARARAAAALTTSLQTAARLGAGAVVLHLGTIQDDAERTGGRLRFELENRHRAGDRGSAAFSDALARLEDFVAAREPEHLARALPILETALALAERLDLRLGLETGAHCLELPGPEGMRRLLERFDTPALGAWLDTGHVALQAELGRPGFAAWFDAVGPRWVGAHYHDALGLRDHLPPGRGRLDFDGIEAGLPRAILRTYEVDWYWTPEELLAGKAQLERVLARARAAPP